LRKGSTTWGGIQKIVEHLAGALPEKENSMPRFQVLDTRDNTEGDKTEVRMDSRRAAETQGGKLVECVTMKAMKSMKGRRRG
jgi:hypothetical protein